MVYQYVRMKDIIKNIQKFISILKQQFLYENVQEQVPNEIYKKNINENQYNYQFQNQEQTFSAILGIKVIQQIPFLLVVRQQETLCTFQGSKIYQIKSIDYYPIISDTKYRELFQEKAQENQNCTTIKNQKLLNQKLNNILKIFQQGFHYYADNNYELNKTYLINVKRKNQKSSYFQNNGYNSNSPNSSKESIYIGNMNAQERQEEKYYKQFIWNSNIIKFDIESQYMKQIYKQQSKNKKQTNIREENKNLVLQTQIAYNKSTYRQQCQIFSQWCTPIIQGYIQQFQQILPSPNNTSNFNNKIQYLLISRRSNKKAGTRFYSRGIDDHGNVANYTQTQQIIQFKQFVLTNVQLRGSVPVFFQQIGVQGINIELNIQRTKQMTKKAFINHFNMIKKHYNRAVCVNLLAQGKKSEQKLTQFFEQMIKSTLPDISQILKYSYFDFHQQCKNNKFQNTQILIDKIRQIIQVFGFNCYNRLSNEVIKRQTGVFRVNCLDCLDRTNYVQSRICLNIFQNMIKTYSSKQLKEYIEKSNMFKNKIFQQNSEIINLFNNAWAQNGDTISFHYTGIGSTHTEQFQLIIFMLKSITKTGKRTFLGTINHKMRSLMRFYTQFTDIHKHEAINNFLGNKSLLRLTSANSIFDNSLNYQNKIHEQIQQQILALSWQFKQPEKSLQQLSMSTFQQSKNAIFSFLKSQISRNLYNKYSLIVLFLYIPNYIINWQCSVGFKNIFSPFNFTNNNKQKSNINQIIKKWSNFLIEQLQSNTGYINNTYSLISSNKSQDNSSQMLVFCKKNKIDYISSINNDQITSQLKTKEVVLLTKFKYLNTPLVFQAFNVKNINNFVEYLNYTHEKGFQNGKLGKFKSSGISQQSYRLILGNIGCQIKLKQHQFERLQQQLEQCHQKLLFSLKHNPQSNQKNSNSNFNLSSQNLSLKISKILNHGYENDQLKQIYQQCDSYIVKKSKKHDKNILLNYNQPPLEFIPKNNRLLFWNQCGKIVRVKKYDKIQKKSKGNKQKQYNQIFVKQQDKSKTQSIQNCVYLQLSYEMLHLKHDINNIQIQQNQIENFNSIQTNNISPNNKIENTYKNHKLYFVNNINNQQNNANIIYIKNVSNNNKNINKNNVKFNYQNNNNL